LHELSSGAGDAVELESGLGGGNCRGEELVREWTPWAADWRHWNQTGDKEGVDKVSAGNIDTMNFLLLGRAANEAGAWVTDFRERLLKNQQADGSWKPGGQLPLGKRPARETVEVTTQWTLLALASCDEPVPDEVIRRAEVYLVAAAPGVSTEWHALRLLRRPEDGDLHEALLKWQTPEGGWGWRVDEPADAFGTGLAMYALARAGGTLADPALARALAFLQATQASDGSWPVPSTRARDKKQDQQNRDLLGHGLGRDRSARSRDARQGRGQSGARVMKGVSGFKFGNLEPRTSLSEGCVHLPKHCKRPSTVLTKTWPLALVMPSHTGGAVSSRPADCSPVSTFTAHILAPRRPSRASFCSSSSLRMAGSLGGEAFEGVFLVDRVRADRRRGYSCQPAPCCGRRWGRSGPRCA
jgi:hypothetical protein